MRSRVYQMESMRKLIELSSEEKRGEAEELFSRVWGNSVKEKNNILLGTLNLQIEALEKLKSEVESQL